MGKGHLRQREHVVGAFQQLARIPRPVRPLPSRGPILPRRSVFPSALTARWNRARALFWSHTIRCPWRPANFKIRSLSRSRTNRSPAAAVISRLLCSESPPGSSAQVFPGSAYGRFYVAEGRLADEYQMNAHSRSYRILWRNRRHQEFPVSLRSQYRGWNYSDHLKSKPGCEFSQRIAHLFMNARRPE